MQIMNFEKPIDFMRFRKPALMLSVFVMLMCVVSLATNKLNFGLDFTGGTLIEVGFEQPADLTKRIR